MTSFWLEQNGPLFILAAFAERHSGRGPAKSVICDDVSPETSKSCQIKSQIPICKTPMACFWLEENTPALGRNLIPGIEAIGPPGRYQPAILRLEDCAAPFEAY